MRSAVQYFSSSLRLGPSEGEGKAVGSTVREGDGSAGCVGGAEGVAEPVGSTAPASVDGVDVDVDVDVEGSVGGT
ncbi:hypothetical protein [Streptomyces sp. BK340]|uniref:hypothetical protein n=1 Tax=Streptomyces sp. BK340 TaxID=2572903 RepID=UPI0011A4C15C|nr:hypothetical protein [Streptomyces sp. BK340]